MALGGPGNNLATRKDLAAKRLREKFAADSGGGE